MELHRHWFWRERPSHIQDTSGPYQYPPFSLSRLRRARKTLCCAGVKLAEASAHIDASTVNPVSSIMLLYAAEITGVRTSVCRATAVRNIFIAASSPYGAQRKGARASVSASPCSLMKFSVALVTQLSSTIW